jgi:hypothetical protein
LPILLTTIHLHNNPSVPSPPNEQPWELGRHVKEEWPRLAFFVREINWVSAGAMLFPVSVAVPKHRFVERLGNSGLMGILKEECETARL